MKETKRWNRKVDHCIVVSMGLWGVTQVISAYILYIFDIFSNVFMYITRIYVYLQGLLWGSQSMCFRYGFPVPSFWDPFFRTRDSSSAEITEGLVTNKPRKNDQHCTIGHSPICFTSSVGTNHAVYIYIYIFRYVYIVHIHGCIMSYTMYDMSYVNLTAKKKSCTKFNKWMMIYQNI